MSAVGGPFRDEDFHAFADGVSAPDRRAALVAYLATSPADTERLLGWQRQNDLLRAAFPIEAAARVGPRVVAPSAGGGGAQGLGSGPTLPELGAAAKREAQPPLRQALPEPGRRRESNAVASAAGMALAALVAVMAGIYVSGGLPGVLSSVWLPRAGAAAVAARPGDIGEGLLRRAIEAHQVFAEDLVVPVEFDAKATGQLLAYLSQRAGVTLRAPNLTAQAFRLLGGRVLPVPEGIAAMLVYEGPGGQRIALVAARAAGETDPASLYQPGERGPVHAVKWTAGEATYVLTSTRNAAETLRLAMAAAIGLEAARALAPDRPASVPR